jgi:hypothetical protein
MTLRLDPRWVGNRVRFVTFRRSFCPESPWSNFPQVALRFGRRSRLLHSADASEAEGDLRHAIGALSAANLLRRDSSIEARIVELRRHAFSRFERTPLASDTAVPDLFAVSVKPPEIPVSALNVRELRSGIEHHGCLLVRGLVSNDTALRLRNDIDETFKARELGGGAPWFEPFDPEAPGLSRDRVLTQEPFSTKVSEGAIFAADSPRTLFDLLNSYEELGVPEILTEFFGERPALSVNKTVLRRLAANSYLAATSRTGGQPSLWHQDGAFLGRVRAVNIWLALSHCGDDAPGLDLIARHIDLMPTGTGDAAFGWTVGSEQVDACGEVTSPVFGPGDALLFDERLLHRTSARPGMTKTRYAIEAWFFAASAYRDSHTMLAI